MSSFMRAVVTREPGQMEVVERPVPELTSTDEVLVRPEAVGLCGSDIHMFRGDLGAQAPGDGLYPRVQGHELSCVVEGLGGPAQDGLTVGDRVAVLPVIACGECYPCRTGRPNVCAHLMVLGVHVDGGLAERMVLPRSQVFSARGLAPEVTAFIEPVAVAVHAVRRARIAAGEHAVVFGAGPIGQAVCLAAKAAGAVVAVVEPLANRRELGPAADADLVVDPATSSVRDVLREWSGTTAPEVVVDTTAAPAVLGQALDVVTQGGRVVLVGLTDQEATFPYGLPAHKELDILGTSCCDRDDFVLAVRLVSEASDKIGPLITQQFALDRAAEAIAFIAEHPERSMKVVVRVDGTSSADR